MRLDLQGHYWTLAPWLRHQLRRSTKPLGAPFRAFVDDPTIGRIPLSGRLRDHENQSTLLVILHGLGGNIESHYTSEAAAAAERAGISYLLLNLRGADGVGVDFYHAGLYADMHAALASPELQRFERIYVIGYSLGGHISLRYASFAGRDPRVRAIAAVCPPLDLDRGCAALDLPERYVYRRHVLVGLKDMYASIASRRPMPISIREARAIESLRSWDNRIVAPRYGYRSAEHYYAEENAADRLRDLGIPSLLLAAEADPMIPVDLIRASVRNASPHLDVRWLGAGGHVGFPGAIDIGSGSQAGNLETQALNWLLSH